jgi:hypothetical protein
LHWAGCYFYQIVYNPGTCGIFLQVVAFKIINYQISGHLKQDFNEQNYIYSSLFICNLFLSGKDDAKAIADCKT